MELFDKIYSCYYNVVRHILEQASLNPITKKEMEQLCRKYAYQESALAIVPKLTEDSWPLLQSLADESSWTTRLKNSPPVLPLTGLQKSWLKALLQDRRFQLFFPDEELEKIRCELKDVEPLYSENDFYYFDRYRDGDSYDTPEYREHFQTILRGLREGSILKVAYDSKKGRFHRLEVIPYQLQYSSRDDKFRVCCLQNHHGHFYKNTLLNIERIKDCELSGKQPPDDTELSSNLCFRPICKAKEPVLLQISGERNSLERCMLHFANYEKHTEYDEAKKCWLCSIFYDLADETELLIDVLSFGPVIRVLGPESFLEQIRDRVRRQHHLFYDPQI